MVVGTCLMSVKVGCLNKVGDTQTLPIKLTDKVLIHTVDNTTGEVLYTERLSLESYENRKRISKFNPYTSETEDQLRDYCLSVGETQHTKMWNNLNMLRQTPHYTKMLKLFRHTKYRNIIFLSRGELCRQLSTSRPSEVLKRMVDAHLIKYQYFNSYRHYRIEANPAYIFKGDYSARTNRIDQWYKTSNNVSDLLGSEVNDVLDTYTVDDDYNHVEWFYTDTTGHHLIYPCNSVILWCNDFDFSLLVNGETTYEQLQDAYEGVVQQGTNTYFKSLL